MEQPFAKPKFRIWPKIAFLIAVIFVYLLLYALLRINKDMVYVLDEKEAQHRVEVLMPENHEIFMTALESGENSTEIDEKLEQEVSFYKNKKRYIEAFFLPARFLETKCREQFSLTKQN